MYVQVAADAQLAQGDIFSDCPLLEWVENSDGKWIPKRTEADVIVVTQSCDLENVKVSHVQVAVIHDAAELVKTGIVKAQTIRDQVRRHRVYGWYFLPAGDWIPESVVDLRSLHSVPRDMLVDLAKNGKRVCRLTTPYREHMAQHFAVTYSRIALPEPYPTTE